MTDSDRAIRLEDAFRRARSERNRQAFSEWVALAEPDLRDRVSRVVRSADLDLVMRETMGRIWNEIEAGTVSSNENASLLFARRIAADVAREDAFRRSGTGNETAFAEWMSIVEIPLRLSLRRFARVVDVEAILQETLVRMWLVARDPRRILQGASASLRFAYRVARNVVREEVRRNRVGRFVDLDELENHPEGRVDPDPPPDPALGAAIVECIKRLPSKPREALEARLGRGHRSDRELARSRMMTLNTFLQNIVRARRFLAQCLESRGVRVSEILSWQTSPRTS